MDKTLSNLLTFNFLLNGHNIFMKNFEYGKTIRDKDECIIKPPKERIKNEYGKL